MRLAILLSLTAAIGAAPAFAADQPPPPAGWHRPSPEQMEAHHAAMEARKSADVALLLGLRADQKPALDSFLAASHPHRGPGDRDDHGPRGDMPPETGGTIANLDRMAQHIDAREAEAKQRIEATKTFYASLTPDQQKRFDAMADLVHGHMGGPGKHEDGGRHEMMHGEG